MIIRLAEFRSFAVFAIFDNNYYVITAIQAFLIDIGFKYLSIGNLFQVIYKALPGKMAKKRSMKYTSIIVSDFIVLNNYLFS